MAERFGGPEGKRRLLDAFLRQHVVSGDRSLAEALAAVSAVENYDVGQAPILQGATDSDFFFILLGSFVVERNARRGPIRRAGDHFGELALIDVHATRSATVRALEQSTIARISEPAFAAIAKDHPSLWRHLAIEVARRLRQRLDDVPEKNSIPKVFIGSSREGLPVAECIQSVIAVPNENVVTIWSSGVFGASETAIEALEVAVRSSDFAVLVLSPDDATRSRRRTEAAPRDNVVFELGLFMGALGRRRTFMVRPRGKLKVPSDLAGVTALLYDHDDSRLKLKERLANACSEISTRVSAVGPK